MVWRGKRCELGASDSCSWLVAGVWTSLAWVRFIAQCTLSSSYVIAEYVTSIWNSISMLLSYNTTERDLTLLTQCEKRVF